MESVIGSDPVSSDERIAAAATLGWFVEPALGTARGASSAAVIAASKLVLESRHHRSHLRLEFRAMAAPCSFRHAPSCYAAPVPQSGREAIIGLFRISPSHLSPTWAFFVSSVIAMARFVLGCVAGLLRLEKVPSPRGRASLARPAYAHPRRSQAASRKQNARMQIQGDDRPITNPPVDTNACCGSRCRQDTA